MNVAAYQEKKENENTGKREALEEEKKAVNRILERLNAAFLPSFRGQHDKKMVCRRGVPGVTGISRKADSHFGLTQTAVGDHTNTLRRLLIGVDQM